MDIQPRDPNPIWKDCMNPCWFKNWFHKDICLPACRTAAAAKQVKAVVFTGDNCWDQFYCELNHHPEWTKLILFGGVATLLQSVLRNSIALHDNNVQPGRLTVVAHVQRRDHGKNHLPGSYYQTIINNILLASGERKLQPVDIVIIIHTNAYKKEVLQDIGIKATKNVNVQVFGIDDRATLQLTVDYMIHADVCLASKLNLSYIETGEVV